jgi:predicted permease
MQRRIPGRHAGHKSRPYKTEVMMFNLRTLFYRNQAEQEIGDELRFHLEKQTEQNIAHGMSAQEACYAALRQFGNVGAVKEECRDSWGLRFINDLLQDIRYGLRQLRRNPGFTAIAVLTLALGIGATSTIFSWIDATLLNPIPGVANTSDMVSVMRGEVSEHPTPPFSYPDYVDLRVRTRSLSGLLAFNADWGSITGDGKPERVYVETISADYFKVLGVKPLLGRFLRPVEEEKPGKTPSIVISYALWQSRFGADPSIIGKPIHINRVLCTIVGVTPPGFVGCTIALRTDLWAPLVYGSDQFRRRGIYWLNVFGRLKPGVDRGQAQGELNLLMQQIAEQYPDSHRGPNQITLDPLWRSPFGANVYLYKSLLPLFGLAVALLLLACTNVANLLLVRLVPRRREIALRLAMGASRARLLRQLLVESLLVALAGGAAAMLLTTWSAGTFASFFPPTTLPLRLNGQANHSVVLATLLISVLAAVVFGVLPALRTSHLAPVAVLKEEEARVSGGIHRSRLSRAMVVAQISLSLLLLIAAALFTRSFQNEQRSNPGFDPNHVLVASYDLASAGYSRAKGIAFDQQLLAKLQSMPGVQSATLADFSPLSFTIHTDDVLPEGYIPRPHESMEIDRAVVGPDYFGTLRTPLVAGRGFTAQDSEKSQPVAIVNQEFCKRYWPGQDAIGRSINFYGRTLTVVGVARNAKYRLLHYPPAPAIFLPLYQDYRNRLIIHLRVAGAPKAFASVVEKTVGEIDPNLPLYNVTTLKASMQFGSVFERMAAILVGSFGLLALILAAVGIYGVVAFSTRQRTHEIGIRMALGARKTDVLKMVVGQGIKLALIGVMIGTAGALALTRFLSSLLYGVKPTDPVTFIGVSMVLIAVALAACYVPARRAANVDPMVALRYE